MSEVYYCSECRTELVHDLCPRPGCLGLPEDILPPDIRELFLAQEDTEVARSLVPYIAGDERKFEYIAARYNGYSMREALAECGVDTKEIQSWRMYDSQFRQLEGSLASLSRREIRQELNALRFLRNYHKVLKLDYGVLGRAVRAEVEGEELSAEDRKYLSEVRKHYTPSQLDVVERISKVESQPGEFDEIMLRVRRFRQGQLVDDGEVR